MSRIVGITVALALFTFAPDGSALAQGRGRGHAKGAAKTDRQAEQAVVIDREGHVRVIREYARSGSLPPGLDKREALPPGLRKQLRERGELPPGLQKRLVPVPAPLIARLPPVPPYYHRYFAGDDLIVINTRTNRIEAIIPNVWR
jgi:hypothetical protein